MVLYLPKELYFFYLEISVLQKKNMYEIFKEVLYKNAVEKGFKHDSCRFKNFFKKDEKGIDEKWLRCIICDRETKFAG